VNVHHVKAGTTADDAIIRHLRQNGTNARNILVVSSDHRVKAEARALHAEVMNSEAFAQTMANTLNSPAVTESKRELPPSAEEVDEMLELMTRKNKE
jgi:predicted RNA-binding protein with PIN domain